MRKTFYLSTCSTCKRIIKELNLRQFVTLQDIKQEPITEEQVDAMRDLSGSYEALFSRRAVSYRKLNLGTATLSESDYKRYILNDYTFLKRPVTILNDAIFIGNSSKVVQALAEALTK